MGIYTLAVNDFVGTKDEVTEIGSQVANGLLDVEGVKASFVFTQCDEIINISARSIDEVNVEIIMNRLGGGGHFNMAGCQMRDCTMDEAVRRVKGTIADLVRDAKEQQQA